MLNVHYAPGDGMGWALDEDLRQIRSALAGSVRETGSAAADVIHTPFWQNLGMVAAPVLKQSFVIAQADNPPFFYLKQPEFAVGQTRVDLWVARSREAFDQFQRLRLPVEHIPYAIDPGLFFPISEKKALRREFGIPENAYVIANFHRDSEGADLNTPKVQKAPEFLVAILKRLRDAGSSFHVLLAGPRRHWLRNELRREGIPFTFVGKADVGGDDFGVNILDRVRLNKLYNASDLYLIPSRWEGGPQSAMEAAACRCKILSTPVGVARDILEPESLVQTAPEAAGRVLDDILNDSLDRTIGPQFERWKASHTIAAMGGELRRLYSALPEMPSFRRKNAGPRLPVWQGRCVQLRHSFKRRIIHPALPKEVAWNHKPGANADLDEILGVIRDALGLLGIRISDPDDSGPEIIGWPDRPDSRNRRNLQWIVPGMSAEQLVPSALLVAPSVQDILNLRAEGHLQAAVACGMPMTGLDFSNDALFVEPGDVGASVRIWRALAAGQPVIYPEGNAYYEQVFHAGLRYSRETEAGSLKRFAGENREELQTFAHLPAKSDSMKFIKILLRS